jgi:heme A synthase
MELEKRSTPIAKTLGLGRLALLLIVSILGIAGFWHVMYGVSAGRAIAVVGEIAVLVTVAFLCAWRWTR